MTVKITTANGGSDSLDFGCAQTAIVATVTGTEVSSGEGKLELKTTTGGTSATKATVLANGNVGIGSSNPDQKLHVAHAGRLGLRVEATTTDIAEVLLKNTTETWGIKNEGGNLVIADESTGIMATVLKDSGNVGIGTTAPVTQLHIEGGGTSLPATTGTTPSAGTTLRIRPGNNAILDIGGNSTSGAWLQSYDQTGMQTEYPLLLNPNGGNVGIGSTAPALPLEVECTARGIATSGTTPIGALRIGSPDNNIVLDTGITTGNYCYIQGTDKANLATGTNLLINPNGGNVLVGTTSLIGDSSRLNISYTYTNSGIGLQSNTASAHNAIMFTNTNGTVGTITTSGSSTAYNTSSDYRLKENVQYEWSATERLKKLKPAQFNFLSDPDNTVDGFLAHEAQEVVPEAVTGVKDEVDDDGNPVMQGIDQAKLVPLLVKTIQELEARIAKLEGNK